MIEKKYNPMSKEFQDECIKLGLTGRQLIAKYKKEGRCIEKCKKKVRICCICKSYDTYIKTDGIEQWHKHECQKVECTRYLCNRCYDKYDSNSRNNTIKFLADRRTGNIDSNSNQSKGDNSQELACILYGWIDLNKENDNYMSSVDCYDPKTGLYYQVRGRYYNSDRRFWVFTKFISEEKKIFEIMVCFCFSKDGKIVERIYKFPEKIVKNRSTAWIYENNLIGWYEEYRETNEEELKKANEILKQILVEKGLW